jgi:hypothetical protein
MNTISTVPKKLAVSVLGAIAAAGGPAVLLLGAAMAHADDVIYDPWSPGNDLIAHVQDTTNNDSLCTYNSIPGVGPYPMVTYHSAPFWLPAGANVPVDISPTIPGLRNWTIAVSCELNGSPTTVYGGPPIYFF